MHKGAYPKDEVCLSDMKLYRPVCETLTKPLYTAQVVSGGTLMNRTCDIVSKKKNVRPAVQTNGYMECLKKNPKAKRGKTAITENSPTCALHQRPYIKQAQSRF